MGSFFDLPSEIIIQIIGELQDDLPALRATSQTCHSLHPFCRPFIFRSVKFTSRPSFQRRAILNLVKSFGRLLDKYPEVADYVQTLMCEIRSVHFAHDDIPQILMRFHRVRSFQLQGGDGDWNTLRQPWRESLSHIIHLPTIESLDISYCKAIPIALFSPCLNLTNLTVTYIDNDATAAAQQEFSVLDMSPQIRSFTLGVRAAEYTGKLLAARGSNDLPLLDFRNLRALSIDVDDPGSDLPVVHALLNTVEKLETLEYIVDDWPNGFEGFAASINPRSLSTLTRLQFQHNIGFDFQDPLFGISAELEALSGINRVEVIDLCILVDTDCSCNTGDQWATLDAALATGFPALRHVKLHIIICVYEQNSSAIELRNKLQMLPQKQLLRLSTSSIVLFDFSAEIALV